MPSIINPKNNYYPDTGTGASKNNKATQGVDTGQKPGESDNMPRLKKKAMDYGSGLDWGLMAQANAPNQGHYLLDQVMLQKLRELEQQNAWDWYYKIMGQAANIYPSYGRPKYDWSVSPNEDFRREINQPFYDHNYYRYLKSEAPGTFWEQYFRNFDTAELRGE